MSARLNTMARNESTNSEIKKMRKEGNIPGVVYGKGHESSPITVNEKELIALLNSTPHAVITMNVPHQGVKSVMINEIQRDKINRNLLHVDFHQINMNEPIQTVVRIDLKGDCAGVRSGGFLQTNLHEIAIKCMPNKIPESIEIDISKLEIGESVYVKDLEIPKDVELKSELDDVIATVSAPNKEVEPETAPEVDSAENANDANAGQDGNNKDNKDAE